MKFEALVQQKAPARYLGAKVVEIKPVVNQDAYSVRLEGMPKDEYVIVTCMEMFQNGAGFPASWPRNVNMASLGTVKSIEERLAEEHFAARYERCSRRWGSKQISK